MATTTNTCKNCGNQFTGKYCNACGEKLYHDHDKKVLHLFEEVFHFIFHFEGTFLRTAKTFLTRPGKFSFDYCAGIRRKYFAPISFFLTLVVIYLVFPRFQGLNMRYEAYVAKEYNYSWYAAPIAKKKMSSHHITEKVLAEKYNKESPAIAKLFLLILIPLSAISLALIFLTSKKFFFDHFIVATEICAFYIFSHFLFLPFLEFIVSKTIPSLDYIFYDGSWVWLLMLLIYTVFIAVAFKNFYRQKWWIVILKSLLFVFIFIYFIRYTYSLLLYYLVMLFL
ncbi:MAG: DUF3667 domain-containing protein [Chitinophagaceae bacterium]